MPIKTNGGVTKKILIVARWPLGGIRTYMRYTFRHLPGEYQLTLLVSSTHEDKAIIIDAAGYGARLLITQQQSMPGLVREVFSELLKNKYDLIISQGFISAVAVYFGNLFFRLPHILTIHGVVEPKFLDGQLRWLKHAFLGMVISKTTLIYAVGHDILAHLFEQFPATKKSVQRSVVIPNGIEMSEFELPSKIPTEVRTRLGIDSGMFLFGFFSRFMPQKGFDLLIEAVENMVKNKVVPQFRVLAVGTDDYLGRYLKTIKDRNLEEYFYFLPFQAQIKNLYLEVNAIVMPSRWEAWPLLPMEALSMGVPIVASDCIGLREAVADTPAFIFPSENALALTDSLLQCMANPRKNEFQQYAVKARIRFDVAETARQLVETIDSLTINEKG